MTDKVADNDYYKVIPWIASSKSSDQKDKITLKKVDFRGPRVIVSRKRGWGEAYYIPRGLGRGKMAGDLVKRVPRGIPRQLTLKEVWPSFLV